MTQEYRDKVVNPNHYDRMYDYLKLLNPHCQDTNWARDAIHQCIREALRTNELFAVGMCVAVPSKLSPGKVYLMIEPLMPVPREWQDRCIHDT